jgi:hypothetical protein
MADNETKPRQTCLAFCTCPQSNETVTHPAKYPEGRQAIDPNVHRNELLQALKTETSRRMGSWASCKG